ncbi:MAG: 4-hydroxyphenylpyruvate dioxygenase [Gammaproteobacteria bacterium]|nr:4-hydroxyphenylpyruvate dioxygenase [Gammaproteobacteria bacterium]
MGPFPHSAKPQPISPDNPAGTNGFAFVEFAHESPEVLRALFKQMGFVPVARHRHQAIELWQQGEIRYLINCQAGSHGMNFVKNHGPSAPSMGWFVVDPQQAFEHAVSKGAKPVLDAASKSIDAPAIYGIGGSLLYFVQVGADFSHDFEFGDEVKPKGVGFYYLDHLTHNVYKGNMQRWFEFYGELFNFKEIRFFDIQGKHSGLYSRALTSPCGKIRIPINEDRGEKGQIVAYLEKYRGEGIQHIAVGTEDIYGATDAIYQNGIRFMPPPPAAYYALSHARVAGHQEPLDSLAKHGILIDGEGVVDGGETKILLQIFSKTLVGPIFFEFIQRKGDDGFGEGNFQALFESIEAQQLADGELA